MRIELESPEAHILVADLTKAPARMVRAGREVTIKGARMVKKQMKVDAAGHKGNYFGRPGTSFVTPLEKAVEYELLTELEAEIGLDKGGVGSLGNIFAYGTSRNAPVFDHTASLRRSTPFIERSWAEAAEKSVLGGGGRE